MQRTDGAGCLICRVEAVGFFERVGIDRDECVDVRAFLVEGFDAVEIHLHELMTGELAGFITGVYVFDGCFDNIKCICLSHENYSFRDGLLLSLILKPGENVQG